MPAEDTTGGATAEVLASAVALSTQMLEAAKAGDWDRLAALERERSRRLEAGLSGRSYATPARATEVKALLATCLRLNDEIAALTEAHMARLGELIAEMSRVSAAISPPLSPPE